MPEDHAAENRATYNRIALAYFDNQIRHDLDDAYAFPRLAELLLGRLSPNALVADLGCGPAIDGWRFAERGFQVVGIDLSEGMLAVATSRLGGRLAQGDLRSLPIRTGCLDGIWCAASLLHVPERFTRTVLEEFHRSLRPGGHLGLVTALGDGEGFESVSYAPDEQRWYVYRHRDQLARQLEMAGFRIEFDDRIPGNRDWLTVLATTR